MAQVPRFTTEHTRSCILLKETLTITQTIIRMHMVCISQLAVRG